MKKCLLLILIVSATLLSAISCISDIDGESYSQAERLRIDSLVRAQRTPDSLLAVALRFAEEDNIVGQVVAYRELGRMYRNASRYQEAIDIHTQGLRLAENICDTLQIIQACNNIGTVYRRIGALEDAASWHFHGLTMCDMWDDTTSVALKNRVVSLNGLGNVYLSMGQDSLAMSAFREALRGETSLRSYVGMAINYANIGALHEDDGQIDSAKYFYRLSLQCNEKAGSSLGISLCHSHFGRLAEQEGNYHAAFDEYKISYDVLSNGSDKWHWLESCTSLARVSMNLGYISASENYLKEALTVAEDLDSAEHLVDIYYLYYVMSSKKRLYAESLHWHEKYSDCLKRLYSERKNEAIYDLKAQYEREKNQQEIRLISDAHRQKSQRHRMVIVSVLIALVLAALIIVFLVYSLRLRSRNNRILKELDRTRNNYFTDLAHEFRTPLTIIFSAAGSIYENASDDALKDDAYDIKKHADGLLNLVNQLLDVAKMTSGLAPQPVWRKGNVVAFISGICERNKRYAVGKGIELNFSSSTSVMEIDFVPDLMVRIVQNLLSNAFKFSEKGTCVSVSLYRSIDKSSGEGKSVLIFVRDQGIGMTSEQLETIFQPFYQAEGCMKDMGTGLGLTLVNLAAQAMGGRVSVESAIGEGTEFIVEIPVRHDLAEHTVSEESMNDISFYDHRHAEVTDDQIPNHETPRILIVEDAPEVARWEMRQLGKGYTFCFATDGAEGLRKAEEFVPDLIISDVSMPVMDGLEMCRRVRASELLCHIPIVMVTARATHEDRLKGLEAGADAYLEKPYDENELELRVRKLLHHRAMLKSMFSQRFVSEESVRSDVPAISVTDRIFLEKFETALEDAFVSGKVDCEDLASVMCIGRAQLNRKIKAITGYKTTEYILMARISKAKKLLHTTDLPIGEISMQCGIEDVGYFSTIFRKHVGVTPTIYRNS